MKTLNQRRANKLNALFIALTALVVILASCSKNDDDDVLVGNARVMIVNSGSGSAAQDFYLDNVKVNTQAVAYTQNTAYITTPAGYSRKGEFKNTESATANFTGYVDLFPDKSYTFFSTTLADGTGNSSAVFQDETVNTSTKARLRFVNLAGGLTAANLSIAGGASLASNIDFGKSSSFMDVEPGTLNLQTALATGAATGINIGSFTFQAGKIYTIYTSGSLTGTVNANLIIHN